MIQMIKKQFTLHENTLLLDGIDSIELKILEHFVRITENKMSVIVSNIENARTCFDTVRAIINFIKYDSPKIFLSVEHLREKLYFPPLRTISSKSIKNDGSLFEDFYKYDVVQIDKEILREMKAITIIANSYSNSSNNQGRIDRNYYYRLLKWFTFSLDEFKWFYSNKTRNNQFLIMMDTLFIRFYPLFEIIIRKDIEYKYNRRRKPVYYTHKQMEKMISSLTGISESKIKQISQLRHGIVHRGEIFRKDWHEKMALLINTCRKAIEIVLSYEFNDKDALLDERKNWLL